MMTEICNASKPHIHMKSPRIIMCLSMVIALLIMTVLPRIEADAITHKELEDLEDEIKRNR